MKVFGRIMTLVIVVAVVVGVTYTFNDRIAVADAEEILVEEIIDNETEKSDVIEIEIEKDYDGPFHRDENCKMYLESITYDEAEGRYDVMYLVKNEEGERKGSVSEYVYVN